MRIRFVMDRFPSRVSGRVNVALIFFEMYVKISVCNAIMRLLNLFCAISMDSRSCDVVRHSSENVEFV